jgi:hypothetical protein
MRFTCDVSVLIGIKAVRDISGNLTGFEEVDLNRYYS